MAASEKVKDLTYIHTVGTAGSGVVKTHHKERACPLHVLIPIALDKFKFPITLAQVLIKSNLLRRVVPN